MDRVKELYEEILADGDCLSLKQLAVSGDDLLADGMKKGPELGSVLQALLDEVLEDPARNRKEYLLERSRSLRA
jgi:tRNA nucleotidyltransferase (CCA-adding enzyme)